MNTEHLKVKGSSFLSFHVRTYHQVIMVQFKYLQMMKRITNNGIRKKINFVNEIFQFCLLVLLLSPLPKETDPVAAEFDCS
jgi:hypothetical protein